MDNSMITQKKRGVNWIWPVTPLSAPTIFNCIYSSPDCVSIAAPKKVPKRITAVAKSAIGLSIEE